MSKAQESSSHPRKSCFSPAGWRRLESSEPRSVFPVSRDEFRAVKQIAEQDLKMKVVCPARCKKEDIDVVADAGASEVAVFIGTSPQLMKYSLQMTKGEILTRMVESVEYAKERGLYVHAVSEDTTRSDEKFVLRFFTSSIEAGQRVS